MSGLDGASGQVRKAQRWPLSSEDSDAGGCVRVGSALLSRGSQVRVLVGAPALAAHAEAPGSITGASRRGCVCPVLVRGAYDAARARCRGFATDAACVVLAAVALGVCLVAAVLDHAHADDARRAALAECVAVADACPNIPGAACACWVPEEVQP